MHLIKLIFVLFPFAQADNAPNPNYHHDGDARKTFDECMKPEIRVLMYHNDCVEEASYEKEICNFDISDFTEADVSRLLNKLVHLGIHLKCDNSVLLGLNFANLASLGYQLNPPFKPEKNKPAMVIVNNMHLKTIDFGRLLSGEGDISPGFWTIFNNPRLTRYSIDTINTLSEKRSKKFSNKGDHLPGKVFMNSVKMQNYGECNFKFTNSSKTSLSWEEFRWCRTISHEVILNGPNFNPEKDTAYLHEMTGILKITNTNIENLNFLPVYFGVKSGENEISGNKQLCVSFDDEVRFKRLGFTFKNNADPSCRTTCHSAGLSIQQVLNLKDCVTLKGGLKLDAIDESLAAADLFKTVKVIDGPLEITNAQATIDFRKLEKITVVQGQKNMYLKNCSHPILFPSLKTLEGSTSVEMENCRMDAYKYLKETYKESIVDLSRVVTTTTAAPTVAPANGPVVPTNSQPNAVDQRISSPSVLKTDEETTVQSVDHHESTKEPETGSAVSSTEPESNTEGQEPAHPSPPSMALAGDGNTSDSKGEDESTSANKTTLMIIAGLAGAVFLLTSVAIAVIFLKCAVF